MCLLVQIVMWNGYDMHICEDQNHEDEVDDVEYALNNVDPRCQFGREIAGNVVE